MVDFCRGAEEKITVCTILKAQEIQKTEGPVNVTEYYILLNPMEWILPTRVTDETFRGIMNVQKAMPLGTPTDDIEKALVS